MSTHFELGEIEIQYASADWGPFGFDFADALPPGTTISTCTVRSFKGKVEPGADLALETESTSLLIDAEKTIPVSATMVAVYFNYPGVALEGNHTIIFEVTLNTGAINPFYFYKVKVH
jgi:hypothetical protein